MTYASDTNVSINRTREEIIRTLERYGADGFGFMTEGVRSAIYFRIAEIRVKLHVSMPDFDDFAMMPTRNARRTQQAQQRAYEQACRQRWRALLLIIKAKLEAIESGITTLEEEFLPHIMLPSGERIGDWNSPRWRNPTARARCHPCCPTGGPTDGTTTPARRLERHQQVNRRLLLPALESLQRRQPLPGLSARDHHRGAGSGSP